MPEELTPRDITPRVLRTLSGAELRALHDFLVRSWSRRGSQRLPDGLNNEEFVNRFAFVVNEFERREQGKPARAGALLPAK